jgi:hypothetical protein
VQLSHDQLTAYLYSRGYWQAGRYAGTTSLDLGDNTGYIVSQTEPPGLRESQVAAVANPAGFESPYMVPADWQPQIASAVYVPDWNKAVKDANNGGGWVEAVAMAGIGAAVGAAAWNLAGSLTTDGFSLGGSELGADIETTTVSMSESGVSNVNEFDSWYADRFSTDPFATTADVNAGWSYEGGYEGVDWYNSAGIGEAAGPASALNDILGSVSKAVKSVGGILATGSAALQATRNNLAQPVPNYQRSMGGMNLGLLAVAAIAWKML